MSSELNPEPAPTTTQPIPKDGKSIPLGVSDIELTEDNLFPLKLDVIKQLREETITNLK
jgi:hypothetical protein